MLHGDEDDTVPIKAGKKLFDAVSAPKEFFTVQGAGHNDVYIVGGRSYVTALQAFVERLAQ